MDSGIIFTRFVSLNDGELNKYLVLLNVAMGKSYKKSSYLKKSTILKYLITLLIKPLINS